MRGSASRFGKLAQIVGQIRSREKRPGDDNPAPLAIDADELLSFIGGPGRFLLQPIAEITDLLRFIAQSPVREHLMDLLPRHR